MRESKTREFAAALREAWPRAQKHWLSTLLVADPIDDPNLEALARIDMSTREVAVNGRVIRERRLTGSIEAILAHEIGHHVKYPGSLLTNARLRLLERTLVPIPGYSAVNLFTDLMINERLGGTVGDQLVAIYQAFANDQWRLDPAFFFYLLVYEELWRLEPGHLLGPAHGSFEAAYPGCRREAQLLSQRLFGLGPNLFTQFLYFLSILTRYLEAPEKEQPESQEPCHCDTGTPGPDDWAEALSPSAAEREAIARALRERWIDSAQYDRMLGDDAFERRVWGLPGHGTAAAEEVPEVMAAFYRRTAERYLFRPAPQRRMAERIVPTTFAEWEPGDPTVDIDWTATLLQQGPVLGRVQPLMRERINDYEGYDTPVWQPRVEIYLDVSGSMPDPRFTRNAMTLAAQILTLATVRAGGWVRALSYSSEFVRYWEWCRSDTEISRFLMHYVGGGTRFPFEVLESSVQECTGDQPIRVVISDSDFIGNLESQPRHSTILRDAADGSASFIALLHRVGGEGRERCRRLGVSVIDVAEMDAFPRMAADLAEALFERREHELVPA